MPIPSFINYRCCFDYGEFEMTIFGHSFDQSVFEQKIFFSNTHDYF